MKHISSLAVALFLAFTLPFFSAPAQASLFGFVSLFATEDTSTQAQPSLFGSVSLFGTEDTSCKKDISSVHDQLSDRIARQKALGGSYWLARLDMNDIRCEEHHNMANMLYAIKPLGDPYEYKILHVHWDQEGKLIVTSYLQKDLREEWETSHDPLDAVRHVCSFYAGIDSYRGDWERVMCDALPSPE